MTVEASSQGAEATSTEARKDMRESEAAMSSAFDRERMRARRTW